MGSMFSSGGGGGGGDPANTANDGLEQPIESVTVPGTALKESQKGKYTAYKVHVKVRNQLAHDVYRRYNMFVRLDKRLKEQLRPGQALPKLPSKKMFGNNSDRFIEKRRAALQRYLQSICQSPMRGSPDFLSFVGVDVTALGGGNTHGVGGSAMFDWTQRTGGPSAYSRFGSDNSPPPATKNRDNPFSPQ
eukprot:g6989.t1